VGIEAVYVYVPLSQPTIGWFMPLAQPVLRKVDSPPGWFAKPFSPPSPLPSISGWFTSFRDPIQRKVDTTKNLQAFTGIDAVYIFIAPAAVTYWFQQLSNPVRRQPSIPQGWSTGPEVFQFPPIAITIIGTLSTIESADILSANAWLINLPPQDRQINWSAGMEWQMFDRMLDRSKRA
jgi:hypothetical protein